MTFVNAKTVFISDDGTTDMNGFVINKGDLMFDHGWVLHEESDVGNYEIYIWVHNLSIHQEGFIMLHLKILLSG